MVGFFYHKPSRCCGLDFVTESGCYQLVTNTTHVRGGTLDPLITDVPDPVRVAVDPGPLGSSDHSSLSAAISMAQAISNLCEQ